MLVFRMCFLGGHPVLGMWGTSVVPRGDVNRRSVCYLGETRDALGPNSGNGVGFRMLKFGMVLQGTSRCTVRSIPALYRQGDPVVTGGVRGG